MSLIAQGGRLIKSNMIPSYCSELWRGTALLESELSRGLEKAEKTTQTLSWSKLQRLGGALAKRFNFCLWTWELGGREKVKPMLSDN